MKVERLHLIDDSQIKNHLDEAQSASVIWVSEDGQMILKMSDHIRSVEHEENVVRARRIYTAGEYRPHRAEWLFLVTIRTPNIMAANEIVNWYKEEHMPILLGCKQWAGVDMRESDVDGGCQLYVLHKLWSKEALNSKERAASRATPWFRNLAQYPWFDTPFKRQLYRLHI